MGIRAGIRWSVYREGDSAYIAQGGVQISEPMPVGIAEGLCEKYNALCNELEEADRKISDLVFEKMTSTKEAQQAVYTPGFIASLGTSTGTNPQYGRLIHNQMPTGMNGALGGIIGSSDGASYDWSHRGLQWFAGVQRALEHETDATYHAPVRSGKLEALKKAWARINKNMENYFVWGAEREKDE